MHSLNIKTIKLVLLCSIQIVVFVRHGWLSQCIGIIKTWSLSGLARAVKFIVRGLISTTKNSFSGTQEVLLKQHWNTKKNLHSLSHKIFFFCEFVLLQVLIVYIHILITYFFFFPIIYCSRALIFINTTFMVLVLLRNFWSDQSHNSVSLLCAI